MTVTLQLANQVRRLGRREMTVEQIAVRLSLPEGAIMDVLTVLGLPLPGEAIEERASPSQEERAAWHAKLPKKWQDRTHEGRS